MYETLFTGDLQAVQDHITAGKDLNAQQPTGETPLYAAAAFGYKDIVNLLIYSGANVNLACTDGATPLYIAAQYGWEEVVKSLVEAKTYEFTTKIK